VGRFPEPGEEELWAGPARNFQVFEPLDFLAEVTQHIPDPGEHLVRYYGWYSNKTRGQRAHQRPPTVPPGAAPARPPTAREARQGWAALIKRVYEADPLCCPKCGAPMTIIAFIERRPTEVIERILRHCGWWPEPSARDPPPVPEPDVACGHWQEVRMFPVRYPPQVDRNLAGSLRLPMGLRAPEIPVPAGFSSALADRDCPFNGRRGRSRDNPSSPLVSPVSFRSFCLPQPLSPATVSFSLKRQFPNS
jgi:hypothetical protein